MTQIGSRDHSVGWYMTDDPNITKPSRELLEGYSGIPADRVISHVSGMDVRKLAFDGVPETQLYGAELEAEYIDLGYEFFLDRDRLQSRFIVADVFDLAGPLEELHGKIDIIQIGLFLHQFDWADQKKALEHVVRISKPSKGSMVVGRQVGSLIPARRSSQLLWDQFQQFAEHKDFVGMDMTRKFIQMGMTRAKRYANHKGGRKYDDDKKVLPQSENHEDKNDKEEASRIFREMWERCRSDPVYLRLKGEFQKEQKAWDKEHKHDVKDEKSAED
ncbi:hypothetical protein MBLNU459_g7381t1 [Dothideomycetes sp. NU459]